MHFFQVKVGATACHQLLPGMGIGGGSGSGDGDGSGREGSTGGRTGSGSGGHWGWDGRLCFSFSRYRLFALRCCSRRLAQNSLSSRRRGFSAWRRFLVHPRILALRSGPSSGLGGGRGGYREPESTTLGLSVGGAAETAAMEEEAVGEETGVAVAVARIGGILGPRGLHLSPSLASHGLASLGTHDMAWHDLASAHKDCNHCSLCPLLFVGFSPAGSCHLRCYLGVVTPLPPIQFHEGCRPLRPWLWWLWWWL